MKIGSAKIDITPNKGVKLAGYEVYRMSDGINDELKAKVIALKQKEKTYILISLDTVAIDCDFVALISDKIKNMFNISKPEVFINCTHTHSGPAGIMNTSGFNRSFKYVFGDYDKQLVEEIERKILFGVEEAISNIDDCEIRYGQFPYEGMAKSRISPDIKIDNSLTTLIFKKKNGEEILIYNYPCHPTILNSENKKISGDYPNIASNYLETERKLAFFMNASCGDVSTRFTRSESTVEELNRMSLELADSINKNSGMSNILNEPYEIKSIGFTINLKIKNLPSESLLEEQINESKKNLEKVDSKSISSQRLRLVQSKLEGLINEKHLVEGCTNLKYIPVPVSVIKIADVLIIYIPGELFNCLGSYIKKELENYKIIICCYGGGYVGYIPDESVYDSGGYEVYSTPYEKYQGEYLVSSIVKKIKEEF
jgi:hypothetical protein